MYLPRTLKAIEQINNSFKCLSCKEISTEPYYTGVCDHLLCKKCISTVNECIICKASFYKKESYKSIMITEAMSYLNEIVDLIITDNENENDKNANAEPNSDESLPELDFTLPIDDKKKQVSVQPDNSSLANSREETKTSEPVQEFKKPSVVTAKRSSSMASQRKPREKLSTQSNSTQSRTQSSRAARKNNKGETRLHLAVMNDDINSVRQLLEDSSIDVNVKDNAGWTALHEACVRGNTELARVLIEEFNANVNALGYQNNTPLHEATLNDNIECVELLLSKAFTDTSLRNTFGVSAIDFARSDETRSLYAKYTRISNTLVHHMTEITTDDFTAISRSQFDTSSARLLDITPSGRSARNSTLKSAMLFGTGMTEENKKEMAELAARLNIKVAKEMNPNVTHVLFTNVKDTEKNICTRTLNYMKGILMGIWIVSFKWLSDSAERGFLIEENSYEAIGSLKMPDSNGPRKGRINASCQYAKLFEDCNFYLHGEFKVFDKNEFIKLIQMAGGKILKREPKLDRLDELMSCEVPMHNEPGFKCTHFIFYDATRVREVHRHTYLNSVQPLWLFSCIDQFKILKPK